NPIRASGAAKKPTPQIAIASWQSTGPAEGGFSTRRSTLSGRVVGRIGRGALLVGRTLGLAVSLGVAVAAGSLATGASLVASRGSTFRAWPRTAWTFRSAEAARRAHHSVAKMPHQFLELVEAELLIVVGIE